MGYDPLSPVASAYVSTLLLPLGRIKRDRFQEFVARISKESVIRLGDISPDNRHDRATFSPKAFPTGRILYNFISTPPPQHHVNLSPFELFREPNLIVCIADGRENEQDANQTGILEDDLQAARRTFPTAALVQLVVFDILEHMPRHVFSKDALSVPPLSVSKLTTMKTVMCDVSARFLAELALKARFVQESNVLETPRLYSSMTTDSPGAFSSVYGRQTSEGMARPPSPTDSEMSFHSEGTSDDRPSKPSFQQQQQPAVDPGDKRSLDGDLLKRSSRPDKLHPSERARIKLKTRQSIIIASLYLASGRWADALRELSENTNRTRAFADHRWYAKGLELILVTMLLLCWNGMAFSIPQVCFPQSERQHASKNASTSNASNIKPPTEADNTTTLVELSMAIPNLIDMIQSAHSQASESKQDYFPPLLFSDLMIRLSCLSALLYRNGGKLDPQLIDLLVVGNPSNPSSLSPLRPNPSQRTGTKISNLLFVAYPSDNDVSDAGLLEKTIILSKISTVLSLAGLRRKQAMVLRDMFSIILARPRLAETDLVSSLALNISAPSTLISKTQDPSPQDEALLDVIGSILATYGIQRNQMQQKDPPEHPKPLNAAEETTNSCSIAPLNEILSESSWNSFGNFHLKRAMLRLSADICKLHGNNLQSLILAAHILRLSDTTRTGLPYDDSRWIQRFATTPLLPSEAQTELSNVLRQRTEQLSLNDQELGAVYWDKFLLRSIEPQLFPDDRALNLYHRKQASAHRQRLSIENSATNGVFVMHSSRSRQPTAPTEGLLVAGENAEFLVTFQNPFAFDSFVERVSFITTGGILEHQNLAFMLKASSFSKARLTTTPVEPGNLTIHGCRIKIRGCVEQPYLILPSGWSPSKDIKIKTYGLDSLPTEDANVEDSTTDKSKQPHPTTLEFRVLPPQPLLQLVKSSKQPFNLHAFSGQSVSFSCTISNACVNTICDFLQVSFKSQVDAAVASFTEDAHFKWKNSSEAEKISIRPGETFDIEMEILAIPELTEAVIVIDYAHVGLGNEQPQEKFYTRQIQVPVSFTVNPAVRAYAVDAIHLPGTESEDQAETQGQAQNFVLLVDFRNESLQPKWVYLRAKPTDKQRDGHRSVSLPSSSALVQAGQLARLTLSLPRLSEQDIDAFGDTTHLDAGLLSNLVGAFWKDDKTSARGLIHLRNLGVTTQIMGNLCEPEFTVAIDVSDQTGENHGGPASRCSIHDLLKVSVAITNTTARSTKCLIRIESRCASQDSGPPFDPTSYVLWSGPLQRTTLVEAQGTAEMTLGAVFTSPGDFYVHATAWLLLPSAAVAEKQAMTADRGSKAASSSSAKILGSSFRKFHVHN